MRSRSGATLHVVQGAMSGNVPNAPINDQRKNKPLSIVSDKECTLTKQDDKMRQRRRLQDRAVDLAAKSNWAEAAEVNQQLVELGEDADTYNRLGKAYFELGRLDDAREAYENSLRLMPANAIARRNIERLDHLSNKASTAQVERAHRQLVDLRLFIAEAGKTVVTTLVDVPIAAVVASVVTGEQVELQVNGKQVHVLNSDGQVIGRVEPKLAQRLSELMAGGNRYLAAIAQVNSQQIRLLIREVFQHPSQRERVSFPGKFSDISTRSYIPAGAFDEYGDDMMEEDEASDEQGEIEEEVFSSDEEELGLDEIEQDMGDDEELDEE